MGGIVLIGALLEQGSTGLAWISLGSTASREAIDHRYVIVSHKLSSFWLLTALAVLGLPLWLWLLERWGAMTEPTLVRALVWPLLILLLYQPGGILLIAFSADDPSITLMRGLSSAANVTGLFSLALLGLLMIWCVLRRLRS